MAGLPYDGEPVVWHVCSAGAIGTSHVKIGQGGQDRFRIETLSQSVILAALADGAGSAPSGAVGAQSAVDTVFSFVKTQLTEDDSEYHEILRGAAFAAREAIQLLALTLGEPLRNFATTLLVCLMTPRGGAALQVGDGVIVVSDGPGEWNWLFWPQKGEYANTTRFLTDPDALAELMCDQIPGYVNDIALMTDGLEALALDFSSHSAFAPFFEGFFGLLRSTANPEEADSLGPRLEAFLNSDRVRSRTDDDLSLILVSRQRTDLSSQ